MRLLGIYHEPGITHMLFITNLPTYLLRLYYTNFVINLPLSTKDHTDVSDRTSYWTCEHKSFRSRYSKSLVLHRPCIPLPNDQSSRLRQVKSLISHLSLVMYYDMIVLEKM